jgi:hypothetical protein
MPSKSRKRFDENFEDIEMLVDLGEGLKALTKEDGIGSDEELDVL